jgi:flagellar motility protein MotE (MotC chaperone)
MSEVSRWKSKVTKLKKKLRSESGEAPDQAIRDVGAAIAARAPDEQQRRIAIEEEQQRLAQQEEEHRRNMVEETARDQRREEERQKLQREQNAGSANIARLRTLIREKYRLDIWIWNERDVAEPDRPIILEQCKKADDILQQIYSIVNDWEQQHFPDPEEWRTAKFIKESLLRKDQHVIWCKTPPWDWREDGRMIVRRPVLRHPTRPAVELETPA